MRPVVYFAHPLGGDIAANTKDALTWLAFLMKVEPEVCFIAPWIACVIAGADDNDPRARERGLLDAEAVIPRCHGIVLCGSRISSGMAREVAVARQVGLRIYSLVGARVLPWRPGAWSGLAAHEVLR